MPNRDISSAMETGLQQGTVRPVLIGRFDIDTDPLKTWTGPGTFAPSGSNDAALNGQVFSPLAPYIEMTNIVEDQRIGGPVTLSVSGDDLDMPLLRQIIRDKRDWRGKKAYLWIGLLNADEYSVINYPVRIKTGFIVNISTARDQGTAIASITIDEDLQGARWGPYRWIDHERLFTGDTASSFIIKLSNKPQGFVNGDYKKNPWQPGDPIDFPPFGLPF